jgi:hypothetical protein
MSSEEKTERFVEEVYELIKKDPDKDEHARSDNYLKNLLEEVAFHDNGRGFLYNLVIAMEEYIER